MRLIDADELLEFINPLTPTKRDTSVPTMSVDDVVYLVNCARTIEALPVEDTMRMFNEMCRTYHKWRQKAGELYG